MAHIKIEYDGLEQQAAALGTLLSNYEALNTRMTNLTNQIQSSWEGQAADAYVNMMTKYRQEAQKIVSVIDEFRKYATTAKEDFQTVDHECANLINNSF